MKALIKMKQLEVALYTRFAWKILALQILPINSNFVLCKGGTEQNCAPFYMTSFRLVLFFVFLSLSFSPCV